MTCRTSGRHREAVVIGAGKGTRNDARGLGDERSGRLGLVFQSAGLAVDAAFELAAGFARNAFSGDPACTRSWSVWRRRLLPASHSRCLSGCCCDAR